MMEEREASERTGSRETQEGVRTRCVYLKRYFLRSCFPVPTTSS